MKIGAIKVTNIKSFKGKTTVLFKKNLNLIVGPNGSGKSNLLDILTITLRRFFLWGYQFGLQDGFVRTLSSRGHHFQYLDRYLKDLLGRADIER